MTAPVFEDWATIRARIAAAAGNFPAYLKAAPRADLERLICDETHRRNVFGFFPGTTGDRAREIFEEISRRAAPDCPASPDGQHVFAAFQTGPDGGLIYNGLSGAGAAFCSYCFKPAAKGEAA